MSEDTKTTFDDWFRDNIPTGDISVYRAVEIVWNFWQEDVKRRYNPEFVKEILAADAAPPEGTITDISELDSK